MIVYDSLLYRMIVAVDMCVFAVQAQAQTRVRSQPKGVHIILYHAILYYDMVCYSIVSHNMVYQIIA